MPTLQLPTDAFQESDKKEFKESPHHERGDTEANITGGYAAAFVADFECSHGRSGLSVTGMASRTAYDESFQRLRQITSYDDDPTYGGPTTSTFLQHYNKWTGLNASDNNTTSGGPVANVLPTSVGFSVVTDVITADTSSTVTRLITYTNGVSAATYEYILDEPYTHALMVSDMLSIFSTKFATWAASGGAGNEAWRYDSAGSIEAGVFAATTPAYPADRAGVWTNGTTATATAAKNTYTTSPTVSGLKFKITEQKDDYGGSNTLGSPSVSYLVTDPHTDGAAFLYEPDGTSTFHNISLEAVQVSNIAP